MLLIGGRPALIGGLVGSLGSAPPVEGALLRGFDPDADSGTTADIYVDASRPDDTGAGTSLATAKKTIQAGITAAHALGTGRVVAVVGDGVKYREGFSFWPFQGTVRGYGTDKPIVSGQLVLSGTHASDPTLGWVQCASPADDDELGATLAATGSVYKRTVATSTVAEHYVLNLWEGDTPIPVCQVRQPGADLFHSMEGRSFVQYDSATTSGGDPVTITDTDVLTGITSAQLVNRAWCFVGENDVGLYDITGFNGVATVTVANGTEEAANNRWNLCNCLPKMTVGTHGIINNGDGTTTIYIWPNSTASLTNGSIEYSTRKVVVGYTGDYPTNCTLENIEVMGAAGASSTDGLMIVNATGLKTGMTLRNVRFSRGANKNGWALIPLGRNEDLLITRCTVEDIALGFGITVEGGSYPATANKCQNIEVRQNVFQNISKAGCRYYHSEDVKHVFNDHIYTGRGSHANALNFYLGCNRILVYGCKLIDCVGYVTIQQTSNAFVGMNLLQGSGIAGDTRAFQDQTNQNVKPEYGETHYFWNNQLLPNPIDLTPGLVSLSLGKPYVYAYGAPATNTGNARWVMLNCVVHGGGVEEPYREPGSWNGTYGAEGTGWDRWHNLPGPPNGGAGWIERDRRGNVYTMLESWQTGSTGWSLDATETVQETLSSVYTDAANDDFTAPGGSPILTEAGVSLASLIATAEAVFSGFDFTVDCDGLPIPDTTAPAPGCFQVNYDSQIADAFS